MLDGSSIHTRRNTCNPIHQSFEPKKAYFWMKVVTTVPTRVNTMEKTTTMTRIIRFVSICLLFGAVAGVDCGTGCSSGSMCVSMRFSIMARLSASFLYGK